MLQKKFIFSNHLNPHSSITLSSFFHLLLKNPAIMVGTSQGTNTFGKDKKLTKKFKKPIKWSKLVINMHKVKIKWVILGGNVNGRASGSPTMEPPKEVKKNKMRKTSDLPSKVPLSMSDLIRKGKDDEKKNSDVNDALENQVETTYQSTKEVLEVVEDSCRGF